MIAQRQYTDRAGCVRVVTVVTGDDGVRRETDVLTRSGRKEWARRVEASRERAAVRWATYEAAGAVD